MKRDSQVYKESEDQSCVICELQLNNEARKAEDGIGGDGVLCTPSVYILKPKPSMCSTQKIGS